jgi:hypothetical protein
MQKLNENKTKRVLAQKIVFDLTIEENLITLDSSFEDHSWYTKDLLSKLITEYSKKYQRPCIFNTMNEKMSDGKTIFYKNFCWDLFGNIMPPVYEKYKYSFTYLCGHPKLDKLHMLSRLFKEDLLKDCLWSCGSLSGKYNLSLPKLPEVIDYDKAKKGIKSCWQEINSEFYKHSCFSLVQETEMSNRSNRYTEKTYKCFWMKHPFILAGNYQTLKLLKQDGFKTFHPYIDESYDEIQNRDERISIIIKEVKALCSKTKQEWKEFMRNINNILKHNYQHAASRKNN